MNETNTSMMEIEEAEVRKTVSYADDSLKLREKVNKK